MSIDDAAGAANGGQRRHFSRFPFPGRARIYSGTEVWDTTLQDISLKGVLLHRPADWNERGGRTFRVDIRLEGGIVISMTVTAVHVGEQSIGFRCERIDMDSFSHLKRLIELNLGQPELLNRELSALG